MIGYLRGNLVETTVESVILDVQGVGYSVSVSSNTLSAVEGVDPVQLWIHTAVREDAIQLYGFATQTEKQLFLSLIKVTGIGPKMAQKILSAARLETLVELIETGDVRGLTALPKVGKKTAEQMILSLKGKLVLEEEAVSVASRARQQVVSALVNLGFRAVDVEKVVESMSPDIDLQEGVRQGLKALTARV